MSYAGNPALEPKVQQRVLTAFGEAVRLYREDHPEEARTILRSILEVDFQFQPAHRLEEAIAAGAEVDLGSLLGAVGSSATADVPVLLDKAREALRQRDFPGALEAAEMIIKELPGQPEARRLISDINLARRAEAEADGYVTQAGEALDAGMLEEARNYLRLAGAKDPEHPGIVDLLARLGAVEPDSEPEGEFEFEVLDEPSPMTEVQPEVESAAENWEPEFVPESSVETGMPTSPAESAAAEYEAEQEAEHETEVPGTPADAREAGGVFVPAASADFPSGDAGGFELAAGDELFTDDGPARTQALLDQGQGEFDAGDYQAAIDTWSRIYLIDADHPEVELRVEQARQRREEVERKAEHLFYEARDAFDQERWEDARQLCQQALELQPQHVEAHDLLARLDTPAAPPPPPQADEIDEDDLFKDEFVPAEISSGALPAIDSEDTLQPMARARPAAARAHTGRRQLPTPLLVLVGGILVLLLVGGFVLRGRVFSGGAAEVEQALEEAERLAASGQFQAAINLLSTVDAEGELGARVSQRQLDYRRRLRAQPTPVPPPDIAGIRDAWAAGRRLETLRLVREGLARAPGDEGLLAVQQEIAEFSSLLPGLADAVAAGNNQNASGLAEQILAAHPQDPEIRRIWVNATFNRALALLRRYQVVESYTLFEKLAAEVDDGEVDRLLQFAGAYRVRARDPRFDLFVASIEMRPLS